MLSQIKHSILPIGSLLTLVMVLAACGDIFGDVENLFDPDSPDFSPPQTLIEIGPAEGATLDTSGVTFAWRHANSNYWPDTTDTAATYDYPGRIFYSYHVDISAWSDWISGEMLLGFDKPNHTYDENTGRHILQLPRLEDGDHTFEVRSRYPSDIEESNWPERNYTISTYDGTALIVSPGYVYSDSGATFIISVKMIDVVNLLGAHLILDYDSEMLAIDDYSIKTEISDIFGISAGEVIEYVEIDSVKGLLEANVAIAGGTVTGNTGSGILARIRFKHIGTIGSTDIEISPGSSLRNVYNDELLQVRRGGRVVIWY